MSEPDRAAERARRTLIVRLSAVGDVIHTLPSAAALAGAGHEVVWAVQPAARPLLEANPAVAAVVAIPARRPLRIAALLAARRALRAQRCAVALDFQGLWKSAAWALVSAAPRRIGYDRRGRKEPSSARLMSERVPLSPAIRHVIDKNLALLAAVAIEAVGGRDFPLPPHGRERARIERELALAGDERAILLHPGGGWAGKLWPAERYGELARRLAARGSAVRVSWGPSERELAERVVAASAGAARLAPATNLLELAALAEASRAVVAADTGPLHLACAVGTPVVALFGPTDPARNGPFDPADAIVARRPSCFPCHRRDCPTHRRTMDEIAVDEVERALLGRLARLGAEARR